MQFLFDGETRQLGCHGGPMPKRTGIGVICITRAASLGDGQLGTVSWRCARSEKVSLS